MAITPLTFRITADTAGFNAGMSQVMGQLRGVAGQVRGAFQGATAPISAATSSASVGVASLTAGFVGLTAVYAGLRSIGAMISIADDAALATARINGLTGSMHQTREAQAALFELAQRLQSSYSEAVGSFSRMLPAVQELGGGVRETTAMTEILLTTAKLSGSSASEAAASAMQFAQALGSGKLQGDELRSILENNNTLARALAEGLGREMGLGASIGIGELRRMGEEGKLTSELVARTLLKSYDDIKAKGASLPVTVGGAWTQISNAFSLLVRNINEGTGVFGALAMVLSEVATVIEVVATSLFGAGEESDKLKDRQGAKEFAQGVGKAFAWLVDVVGAVIRGVVDNVSALLGVFRAAGEQLGAIGAAMAAALRGDFSAAASIMREAAATGAAAVTRLGVAMGESAARTVLAVAGEGEAFSAYVRRIEEDARKAEQALKGGRAKPDGFAPLQGRGGGEDDKAAKGGASAAALMDLQEAAAKASQEAIEQALASEQEAEAIRTGMARDRALAAIEAEQRVSRFQLDNQQITQQQYLAAEMAFEQQKYEVRRQAVEQALHLAKLEGRDPAEVERINAQLLALELDYQQKKQEIGLEVAEATQADSWNGILQSMVQNLGTSFDRMLARTRGFGESMGSIWGSLRAAVASSVAGMIKEMLVMSLQEKRFTLGKIGRDAAKAASGAYSAMAGIPIVGPVLAPAAAAAAFAGVMAFGAGIPSAAGGYDIPAGVNPVTQLHQREMVLPARLADVIRSLADGGQQARAGGPQTVVLQLHPDAMRYTLHDWLEGELARLAARR